MLKVISQNVMSWGFPNIGTFEQRRPFMKQALTAQDPDLIGIQECVPTWAEYFKEDLAEYDCILKYRSESNLEGTPIYWKRDRFDKIDGGYFWLSETPNVESLGWDAEYARITCWVVLRDLECGKEFAFVNTHLDHVGENARRNGILLICNFIRERFGDDMPLIFTGDFNASPDSETMKVANEILCDARASANDSTDMPTFHSYQGIDGGNTAIIDYIYHSNNLGCNRFCVISETDGVVHQSDHFAILAELIL